MTAPVCHIPPARPNITQPGPKPLPGIPTPTPTLEGLLATVQAMKIIIERITNQNTRDNGFSEGFQRKPDKDQKVQWIEQSRVMEKVKVYQNNDESTGNFVEVERINRLVMADKNTGQQWTWDRERKG